VSVHDFDAVAQSLREDVDRFFRRQGQPLEGAAGANTLETNSGFVKRRGDTLLEILYRRSGHSSIAGLDVLDVGCGLGALSLLFASYGATVVGVDPNGKRFKVGRRVARRHALGAEFMRGRAQRLRFPDASFDVAVLNNSFCYIIPREERAQALAEVLRVLRPGGWLVMRNPNRLNPIDQFTRLPLLPYLPPHSAARLARTLGRQRSLVRLTTPGEAKRELRRAGFAEVDYVGRTRARLLAPVNRFARYQHLVARRPEDA
jgi:ubiquinone/menaquinone biosynthesis C-methylase UbiE